MRYFRKIMTTICVIVLVLAVTAACEKKAEKTDSTDKQAEKQAELKEITLNEVAHSIFYAPQYVAIEKGYFEEEGLSIKLVNGAGADNVMTALIAGDADIGFMGCEASIYVYAQGASDYVVNFAQLTQRAGNFLVAREEMPDFTWSDLKGKTVLGGRKGGMPQMIFEYVLKKNGINPDSDLTMVQNIDFGLTAGAFSSGEGDYTVEFEPFATALELEGKGYVVASLGEESGYVPYTAYCVKKSYLDENQDIVLAFTNAIQKGIDYVNSHTPEEIATVIKTQFPETEMENLTKIVERYQNQDTWKEDTIFTKDSFQLLEDILLEAGELTEEVDYGTLVTTEFSQKALQE
jgi:NitT/TauT family transport system substrate-binding protein